MLNVLLITEVSLVKFLAYLGFDGSLEIASKYCRSDRG